jgi:hypothetical protein
MNIIIMQTDTPWEALAKTIQFARPGSTIYVDTETMLAEAKYLAALFPEKGLVIELVSITDEPTDGPGGMTIRLKPAN